MVRPDRPPPSPRHTTGHTAILGLPCRRLHQLRGPLWHGLRPRRRARTALDLREPVPVRHRHPHRPPRRHRHEQLQGQVHPPDEAARQGRRSRPRSVLRQEGRRGAPLHVRPRLPPGALGREARRAVQGERHGLHQAPQGALSQGHGQGQGRAPLKVQRHRQGRRVGRAHDRLIQGPCSRLPSSWPSAS
jgi:hypothetical protein